LALAGPGALEGVEKQAQLALAPHERRESSLSLDLQPRTRLARGDDFPRDDGFGLALQADPADRPRLEVAPDETMGGL
jgi:hypothetical protein